ncbi:MAG: TerB family tellurite resistance protein [Candidatus Puniceispirillales bacterium]
MSIWGIIIGGTAGLAIGGPIGGLIGALAGHTIDHLREGHDEYLHQNVAFSVAMIALSAKMAKSDGKVTLDEVLAFREKVDIPERDVSKVGQLWDLARQTTTGYDAYARQLRQLFGARATIFEHLMSLLFHIANADGTVTDEEDEYLYHVAKELGYDDADFERLKQIYGNYPENPYQILNIAPDADMDAARKAWIDLMRQHHPDRLQAEGLPAEFLRSATDKVAKINAAYESIRQFHES